MVATTPHSQDNPYLGIGLYTIPEAARLLRTPSRTVYGWVRGYKDAALLGRDHPELLELQGYNILTFLDLVEIHVVRMLRNEGVRMITIRKAAERLSEKYSTEHPFAVEGLQTDGTRVFDDERPKGEKRLEELGAYQMVMKDLAKPFFRQLEFFEGHAARMWPIGRGRIVLDPHRSFGRPITARGGVPTTQLYDMKQAGETPDRIAHWYRIPVSAVKDAIRYETQLRRDLLS